MGATLAGAPDVTTGGTSYPFVVTYTQNAVLSADSLAGSVVVTGPGGYSQAAQVIAVDAANVTYAITPPGGSWDSGDAGTYTIAMQGNKVGDGQGKFVAAGNLGTFTANPPGLAINAIDLGVFPWKRKMKSPGKLGAGTTEQYYKLTLSQVSRLRAKLTKVRDEVAFDLRDADGNVLLTSDRPKRRPESLLRALPAGTYYLHVTLKGTVGTNYLMNTMVSRPTKRDLKALGGS